MKKHTPVSGKPTRPQLHPPGIRHFRKSRGRIALLPQPIRDKINRSLDDGWRFDDIREWLFAQIADRDIPALRLKTGDSYSVIFTHHDTLPAAVVRNYFSTVLSNWYRRHYPRWREEQATRQEVSRLANHIEVLDRAAVDKGGPATTSGGALLIRAFLFDAIEYVRKGTRKPADLARLAHAWARLTHTTTETETLKLRTEDAIDTGLRALLAEAKGNPAAIAAFQKFHDLIKPPAEPTT